MVRTILCVTLCLVMSGCGSAATVKTVVRQVVVTAKPRPSGVNTAAKATATLASRSAGSSGAISLTNLQAEQSSTQPNSAITLDYVVDNESGQSQNVQLGATAYSESIASNSFSDPSNDVTLSISPGVHTYQRQFSFPDAAGGQTFEMAASVVTPGFGHTYDIKRFSGLVTVESSASGGQAGSSAGVTPTPAPQSASSGNGSTLLDLQASGTQTAQSFTTSGSEWAIGWAYNCSNIGIGGGLDIEVNDTDSSANFFSPGVKTSGMSDHGIDYEHTGGTFYLQVISACVWHIIVTG